MSFGTFACRRHAIHGEDVTRAGALSYALLEAFVSIELAASRDGPLVSADRSCSRSKVNAGGLGGMGWDD